MAGDNKTTDSRAEADAPDWGDPFPSIQSTLDAILAAARGSVAAGPGIFDIEAAGLSGFASHDWQKVRAERLIVSASAAGTATLTIGSFVRTWNIAAGVSNIPYIATIERGTDIVLGGTAVGITGYIIGTPE